MASAEDVKQRQVVEDRARNISHNVRCTECGSQSIEDSQADVAVLLRRLLFRSIYLVMISCLTFSIQLVVKLLVAEILFIAVFSSNITFAFKSDGWERVGRILVDYVSKMVNSHQGRVRL